jgi:hypothetical protein
MLKLIIKRIFINMKFFLFVDMYKLIDNKNKKNYEKTLYSS